MSLLEVEGLRTIIRLRKGVVHAVDGVDFSIEAGETVGLVGESGCGKTMAAMSIMRLLPASGHIASGAINFNGTDIARISERDMRSIRGNEIGMIFQDPMTSLNPTMSIGNQIAESVRLHRGASKAKAAERAAEVLDLVGMPKPRERLGDYPHQLSGGLRQRAMIAMALACDPKLLIADEPTTALDVTIQAQILALLDELKAKLNMSILLITHDMGVIAGRSDRVIVMYAGRIVEAADTQELFSRTHHPYTQALLASIPQLDQDNSQSLYSIPGLPPDLINPPSGCRFAPRCLYVTDRCINQDPPLAGSDPGHPYACFHPVGMESAVDTETPIDTERAADEALKLPAIPDSSDAPVSPDVPAFSNRTPTPSASTGDLSSEPYLVELRNVHKEFAVTAGAILQRKVGSVKAVSGVSLAIMPGETFGLVGESGCGKTTIGRMMVALDSPTSGTVIFEGHDLNSMQRNSLRTLRRDMQLMFQDPYASLDPRMRVSSLIEEPLAIQGIGNSTQRRERVADLINQVGLSQAALDRYPHEFSGGQRQRIGLARALSLNPKLIVADEPVSALDVSIRSQILNLMKRLQESHGLTYVVISHDLSVVRYLADRVGVMYLGKLVEVGNANSIYSSTAHPYTAGLLATIPVPKPNIQRSRQSVVVRGELPSPVNPPSGCRFRTRCPLAQDICSAEEPPMRPFGDGHLAACHFPLQTPLPARPAAAVS